MGGRIRTWSREGLYRFLRVLSGPGQGLRIIALYHSVGGATPMALPLGRFAEQMAFVARHFRVVRLCDLPAVPLAGHANTVVLTFDDGYRDNHDHALGVLDRWGLKATFFVTAGYLDGAHPTSFGPVAALTRAQVRGLAEAEHEIGAHTMTHPRLTQLAPDAARQEVEASKRLLEDVVGRPVTSFAYPKGDYDPAVTALVRDAGFRLAVTTRRGLVAEDPDWWTLPRVGVTRQMSLHVVAGLLSPVTGWMARLRPSGPAGAGAGG